MIKEIFRQIFKKKPTQISDVNRIEELLRRAVKNDAYWPDFYRLLFQNDLFILGRKLGDDLQFLTTEINGFNSTYAFTSANALNFAFKDVDTKEKEKASYVRMSTKAFFKMLTELNLGMALNRNHDTETVFSPEGIQSLLKKENEHFKEFRIEKGSEINIGIPEKIPEHLLDTLKNFAKKEVLINDIYFGLQIVNTDESYVAVLNMNNHEKSKVLGIIQDLSLILQNMKIDRPVDIAVFNKQYEEIVKKNHLISCLNYSVPS